MGIFSSIADSVAVDRSAVDVAYSCPSSGMSCSHMDDVFSMTRKGYADFLDGRASQSNRENPSDLLENRNVFLDSSYSNV